MRFDKIVYLGDAYKVLYASIVWHVPIICIPLLKVNPKVDGPHGANSLLRTSKQAQTPAKRLQHIAAMARLHVNSILESLVRHGLA